MTHFNDNMPDRKHKHLNFEERAQIKILNQANQSNREIARQLGRSAQTINNEIKRGTVPQVTEQKQNAKTYRYPTEKYFPDVGQRQYEANRRHCGRVPKWVHIPEFIAWADAQMLNHHWSPDAVIGYLKRQYPLSQALLPGLTTLYHWIDMGVMRTKNIDLPEKVTRAPRHTCRHGQANRRKLGPSIEDRPKHIQDRTEFGHWEIDTVLGVKGEDDAALLTLVERQTRFEYLVKVQRKDAASVSEAMHALAARTGINMSTLFKTITSDNGSEFSTLVDDLSDWTAVYFCHPYASYERGTSENQHKLIRRFIPKYQPMGNVSTHTVLRIQRWMNDYPRKQLNYHTPQDMFIKALNTVA